MERLNLHLITFNVGTFFPGPGTNLASLLPNSSLPDVVLVGFQEVNVAPQTLLETLVVGEDQWTTRTRGDLAPLGFIKIRTIKLVGIALSLFCLEKHVPYLRGLETQYTRLGLSGYWGNKGTVSLRFQVYGVSVCVLNSHLAAHDHQNQLRIDAYDTVLGGHTFSHPDTELILYHDYVFWMGDLNFRLAEGSFSFQEIDLLVQKHSFDQLLAADQLTQARTAGLAFSELREGTPTFPPTYKYKVGTSVYDAKRRPAWTDRILFKANQGNYDTIELSMEQQSYLYHPAFLESDHKPVSSCFSLAVFSGKMAQELLFPRFKPLVTFHTDEIYCGEDNVVVYTVDLKDHRQLRAWDWVGVYRAEDSSLQDHVGFLYAPANPARDSTFEIYFDDSVFMRCGNYRLVYYSAESRDILGFSKVIPVRIRDLEPEMGLEATEEL